MLKVFEAFSGIGTQRMALKRLGLSFEVVGISEIDKFALKSYEAIHGDCPNFGDISQINPNSLPDHDLFTYSFPCQDISLAGGGRGLKLGSQTRSSLLWECQKIIHVKKPRFLLMENVKNLVGKHHKEDFETFLGWLASEGYSNYWHVLNAKDYGVPQNRERIFCVSILGEHEPFIFPPKQPLQVCLRDIIEDEVEEKFYLSEDKFKEITWNLSTKDCKDMKPNIVVVGNTPSAYNSSSQIYGTCGISPTLCARDFKGQKCILQTRVRKMTPLEYWRLMGISDKDFFKAQKVNSNSQLYKQAGNAIVVPVLENIFKNLFMD